MERLHEFEIHEEPDLGVPIDLIDTNQYEGTARARGVAGPRRVHLTALGSVQQPPARPAAPLRFRHAAARGPGGERRVPDFPPPHEGDIPLLTGAPAPGAAGSDGRGAASASAASAASSAKRAASGEGARRAPDRATTHPARNASLLQAQPLRPARGPSSAPTSCAAPSTCVRPRRWPRRCVWATARQRATHPT